MANGKQAAEKPSNGAKPAAPRVKADKNPAAPEPEPTPKTQVERMFGNEKQPMLHVAAELELPEHADGEGSSAKDSKDAVDAILNALGTEKFPATIFPAPKNKNNGEAATDYILWDHVAKVASKRAKQTAQIAEEQGVFGDATAYVAGETTLVYNAPEFAISIKKGDETEMVDRELVETVLKEVAPQKWQELLKRCKKPRAGPTQRIVSLK